MSVQCTICGICQVAGDTEVKAQIRLQFRDVTGQKCMAIRSLVASQKVIFIAFVTKHEPVQCHCHPACTYPVPLFEPVAAT